MNQSGQLASMKYLKMYFSLSTFVLKIQIQVDYMHVRIICNGIMMCTLCSRNLQQLPPGDSMRNGTIKPAHQIITYVKCVHDTLANKAYIPIVLVMCNGNLLVHLCSQRLSTFTTCLKKKRKLIQALFRHLNVT